MLVAISLQKNHPTLQAMLGLIFVAMLIKAYGLALISLTLAW
jgi:hypothetical protein